jgi:hypothetical protein
MVITVFADAAGEHHRFSVEASVEAGRKLGAVAAAKQLTGRRVLRGGRE